PSAALTTYQLGLASLILFIVTDLEGITNITINTNATIGLVAGLGLLGTGVAFIGYYYIIDTMGAIKASYVTYLPPVVALFIGVFIMEESITLRDFLGTGLIFVAMYLLNKKERN
ncbi:MAG: EamA family transporter, partial [Sulfurimonas sp.]|nr:EamA family transporter [Sulfurimonas sp.]